MAEAEWDSENFEPAAAGIAVKPPVVTDKWEGEDDDDDVRDAWDQSDEEKEETKPAGSASQVPKKKPLKERIAEKEEKKRKEQEDRKKKEEEALKKMTPKELHEEKMRQQKIQEEADLALAIDAFGLGKESMKTMGIIDSFVPSTKEEFEKFCELLVAKITKFEKSAHYEHFLESLYQKLALGLEAESIKKLSTSLSTLSNEKMKQQKGTTKKKKNQKASLVIGKDNVQDSLAGEDAIYDEFDDYL